MDIRDILIQLANYSLQLVVLIIGGFLINLGRKLFIKYSTYIENKIGKDNYALAEGLVKIIIQAVEQKYPQLKGDGKFELALEKVTSILETKGIVLSEEEKKLLIESCVKEMNYILKDNK